MFGLRERALPPLKSGSPQQIQMRGFMRALIPSVRPTFPAEKSELTWPLLLSISFSAKSSSLHITLWTCRFTFGTSSRSALEMPVVNWSKRRIIPLITTMSALHAVCRQPNFSWALLAPPLRNTRMNCNLIRLCFKRSFKYAHEPLFSVSVIATVFSLGCDEPLLVSHRPAG